MLLKFTKMHGLGNDFIVVDAVSQRVRLTNQQIAQLGDRHFGIGCDQLLIVEAPTRPEMDFKYRIFNGDGSEVEHCGNGARCFAKFVRDQRLIHRDTIHVETKSRDLTLTIRDDGQIRVDMGAPSFEPAELKLDRDKADVYSLKGGDRHFKVSAVSMGNPHIVTRVSQAERYPVEKYGRILTKHRAFAEGVNVSFAEFIDRQTIRLRVYERGAGETLACGTGACATAVTAIRNDWCDTRVNLLLKGGTLEVEWDGNDGSVFMTGPATTVFSGQIRI